MRIAVILRQLSYSMPVTKDTHFLATKYLCLLASLDDRKKIVSLRALMMRWGSNFWLEDGRASFISHHIPKPVYCSFEERGFKTLVLLNMILIRKSTIPLRLCATCPPLFYIAHAAPKLPCHRAIVVFPSAIDNGWAINQSLKTNINDVCATMHSEK